MNEHLKHRMYYLVKIFLLYYLHSKTIIEEIHDYYYFFLVKKRGCFSIFFFMFTVFLSVGINFDSFVSNSIILLQFF